MSAPILELVDPVELDDGNAHGHESAGMVLEGLVSDQEDEVQPEPCQPGGGAAQVDPARELGHRGARGRASEVRTHVVVFCCEGPACAPRAPPRARRKRDGANVREGRSKVEGGVGDGWARIASVQ